MDVFQAIESNDPLLSALALDKEPNMNLLTENQEPLLYIAIKSGNIFALEFLIERKAEVDWKFRESKHSPLGLAVLLGNKDAVSLLLEAGANPGADDVPLCTAAWEDKLEIAQMLLEAEADPNQMCTSGHNAMYTPMHLAKINNLPQMIDLLVQYGGDKSSIEGEEWRRHMSSVQHATVGL